MLITIKPYRRIPFPSAEMSDFTLYSTAISALFLQSLTQAIVKTYSISKNANCSLFKKAEILKWTFSP